MLHIFHLFYMKCAVSVRISDGSINSKIPSQTLLRSIATCVKELYKGNFLGNFYFWCFCFWIFSPFLMNSSKVLTQN